MKFNLKLTHPVYTLALISTAFSFEASAMHFPNIGNLLKKAAVASRPDTMVDDFSHSSDLSRSDVDNSANKTTVDTKTYNPENVYRLNGRMVSVQLKDGTQIKGQFRHKADVEEYQTEEAYTNYDDAILQLMRTDMDQVVDEKGEVIYSSERSAPIPYEYTHIIYGPWGTALEKEPIETFGKITYKTRRGVEGFEFDVSPYAQGVTNEAARNFLPESEAVGPRYLQPNNEIAEIEAIDDLDLD